jgi:hypothetical protein
MKKDHITTIAIGLYFGVGHPKLLEYVSFYLTLAL